MEIFTGRLLVRVIWIQYSVFLTQSFGIRHLNWKSFGGHSS